MVLISEPTDGPGCVLLCPPYAPQQKQHAHTNAQTLSHAELPLALQAKRKNLKEKDELFDCASQGFPANKDCHQDFSGGPVAKTLRSQCRDPGSTPGQGTRSHILQLRPISAK